MARIQDSDGLYAFLRPWVDWLFRRSFRRFQYVGRDKIPTDGAIIYAPNHVDALCDAMAVLGIDRKQKVFVARADIFKQPRLAKVLTWLKIMPIRRMRDGVDEVRHNDETNERAIATLQDKVPFCILPEGTHHPKHTLLPLQKGIFRIALTADQRFGEQMPIYIVPVGLEYGDYFHLWDHLTVNIGDPINVTEYVRQAKSSDPAVTEPQLILMLREELTRRMRESILWVADDEHYEQNWATLRNDPPAPFDRFKKKQVSPWLRRLFLLLTFPLFVGCLPLVWPLLLSWHIICKKVGDPAFHNSVQYVIQVLYFSLTLAIPLPFWWFTEEYRYQYRRLKEE